MLIILLLFTLIRTLRGVPLSSPSEPPDAYFPLDIRDTQSHFGERGINDIIISCFATIFACTWSAVHPNIPATTDGAWTCFKRQFVTMVCALLAPEAIMAWALRQRLAARQISDKYNKDVVKDKRQKTKEPTSIFDKIQAIFKLKNSPLPCKRKVGKVPRWTVAHGFFLQMGGFMLSEGGRPIQVLTISVDLRDRIKDTDIQFYVKEGIIDPPLITEEDIKDRSKGDAISKTLIILQTTWFIAQCIARWSSHLPVTELEVVTLGFAMLNGITYALWWHKPQNVGRPVFLEIKRQIPQEGFRDWSASENATPSLSEDSHIQRNATPSKESHIRHTVCEDFKKHTSEPWKLLYLISLHLGEGLLRPLAKVADYAPLYRHIQQGDLCMPMFYSYEIPDVIVYRSTTLIGVIFGLVHLIPSWFLDFASVEEKWLWRVSAIVITVGPVFLTLWEYFSRRLRLELEQIHLQMRLQRQEQRLERRRQEQWRLEQQEQAKQEQQRPLQKLLVLQQEQEEQQKQHQERQQWRQLVNWRQLELWMNQEQEYRQQLRQEQLQQQEKEQQQQQQQQRERELQRAFWESTFKTLLIMVLPLYIISRMILLTLSLTSLRSLPQAAFQTIEWTTFFPHI